MNQMKREAIIKKSQREIQKIEENVETKREDINKIQELENSLPKKGKTTPAQNDKIKNQIIDIMRDLANDPKLNPDDITEKS